ncbi:hypothetical protein EHJ13_11965 [Cronobacter dublinensis]|uniref:HipA-like kinase domain-containing protein n=1 Tax=Cronobacter dublinensis TaxID=413497 RepID=A0A9Q4T116_9ENTR|nr:HipA family kinase [Cronobacter dublinensis]ELY4482953.1 hypothetical protein [Cronobacter turicensis]NCH88145.1 hypothetical protein [Cronobacter dublinensis]
MPTQPLHVIEIIRRIPDCSTEPFLCRCDDGELYVIKGMPSVPRVQLIAEWISAHIAKSLGLSLPDFGMAYVDRALTQYIPEWKNALYEGHAFATKFIPGVAPITFSQAHKNVAEQEQKKIYLFDKWINNSDRNLSPQAGNVNIIYDYQNDRYYLIDHNLAFDQNVDEDAFDYHVYAPRHRSWIFDIVDKPLCEDELIRSKAILPVCIDLIPDEWLPETEEARIECFEKIEELLNRNDTDVFWSNIK